MPEAGPTIRKATPDDSELLLAFMRELLAEPDVDVPLRPEEFTYSVAQERELLTHLAAADNSVMLLALHGDKIVGQLGLTGGHRRATRHAATLGISVRRDWRNRGVGSALMGAAVDWARRSGVVNRIELHVYERNAPAVHLYRKFGFEVEGRRRRSVLHRGQYVDDLLMALLL